MTGAIRRGAPGARGVRGVRPQPALALVRRRVAVEHLGWVEITAHAQGLCEVVVCSLGDHSRLRAQTLDGPHRVLDQTERYLQAYGRSHVRHGRARRLPAPPPLDLAQLSSFTRDVLAATSSIPFGAFLTYGGVARLLGRPKAARAVGQALGRNPIAIIIPCHRVLAHQGVGGFGSGLPIKLMLLELEDIAAGSR